MRVAVITCEAYSDAWKPFSALFDKFWPDCPYPLTIHSEAYQGEPWCSVVARCAKEAGTDPVLMMLEDFFLTAPVQQDLVAHGLNLLDALGAGCVRLYPSPGANDECGDPYFGTVTPGTVNRISCQAAIWNPSYLYDIAVHSMSTTSEAGDFENLGTPYSNTKPQPVLAFKAEVKPWPMNYLCSAISRGLWDPNAIKLCETNGIEIDRSRRPVAVP